MKIAICDDILPERELIKNCIQTHAANIVRDSEIELYEPVDMQELVVAGNFDCDIAIIDLKYENVDFDGIALAKKINEMSQKCKIIYITHILEFAPEVYETDHCYFVMKNNMDIMLPRALAKAILLVQSSVQNQPIEISSNGAHEYINQDNIIYIEKLDRKTYIHTDNQVYEVYMSLSALLRKLSSEMVRCHSSFIVNIACVTGLNREMLTMYDGTEIPIGKTFREQIKSEFLKYWTIRG